MYLRKVTLAVSGAVCLFAASYPLRAAESLTVPSKAASTLPQPRITLAAKASDAVEVLDGGHSGRLNPNASIVRMIRPGHPVREAHRFTQAIKVGTAQSEVIEIAFHGTTTLKAIAASNDFHVVPGGSCRENQVYTEGQSCTVDVEFKAAGPGRRAGKLTFSTGESALPEVIGLQGQTYGPALAFTPAQITTVPQTDPNGTPLLYLPGDVAVDQGDNLYVSDTEVGGIPSSGTHPGAVYFLDSGGTIQQIAGQGTGKIGYDSYFPANQSTLHQPIGLAVNSFLDVLIAEWGNNSVDGIEDSYIFDEAGPGPIAGYNCSVSSPCAAEGITLVSPYWVATDLANNVYFTDQNSYYQEGYFTGLAYQLINDGGVGIEIGGPFAVDQSQDFYALSKPAYGICMIQGWSVSTDIPWSAVGDGACGGTGNNVRSQNAEISGSIGGYAFDAAGNLYVDDNGNGLIRRVDSYNGLIHTVAGNSPYIPQNFGEGVPSTDATLNFPWGVAVDSNGVIYTATYVQGVYGSYPQLTKTGKHYGVEANVVPERAIGPQAPTVAVVRKIGPVGERNFATQLLGKISPVQTILLSNVGNDYLNVSKQLLGGADPGDFVADPATTSCVWTVPLAPGHSCQLGFTFAPKAAGLRTATVTFTDDTATFENTLILNGVGLSAATGTTTTITVPASGASISYENSVPVNITVANTLKIPTVPTGTVTLTITDTTTNTVLPVQTLTLSSYGTITTSVPSLAVGNYSIVAVYNGDTLDAKSTSATDLFSVVPVPAKVAVASPSASLQVTYGNKLLLSALATSLLPSPVTPTGKITFTITNTVTNVVAGAYTATVGTGGVATYTLNSLLKVGSYTVTPTYLGDTDNATATGSPVAFSVTPTYATFNWPTPAAITVGTKLTATQLNATATLNGVAVPGAFNYYPTVGTTMNTTGQNQLNLTFTPNDSVDFVLTEYVINYIQVNAASVSKKTVATRTISHDKGGTEE